MVKSWHLLVPRINLKLIPFSPSCPISILISGPAICNGSAGRRENWPAGPDPFQTLKISAREKLGGFITGWIRAAFVWGWWGLENTEKVAKMFCGRQFCPSVWHYETRSWTISAPHNNYKRPESWESRDTNWETFFEKANEEAILTNSTSLEIG